jgi:hypothetical protein
VIGAPILTEFPLCSTCCSLGTKLSQQLGNDRPGLQASVLEIPEHALELTLRERSPPPIGDAAAVVPQLSCVGR